MRVKLYSSLLILSLLSNPIVAFFNFEASVRPDFNLFFSEIESSPQDDEYLVRVLFNPSDATNRKAAQRIERQLSPSELSIELVPITTKIALGKEQLIDSWLNVYFFHGTEGGMHINSGIISWQQLSHLLNASSVENHVFQVCYSGILREMVNHCRVVGLKGSIDAEIALLGALCSIYQISKDSADSIPESLVQDLFDITSLYLLTNLNTIIQRSMNPQEPLDGFYIDYGQTETDSRGPWGWIVDVFMSLLLLTNFKSNDWFTTNSSHIEIDEAKVNGGTTDRGELEMQDMGKGDKDTGEFPFDIPLDFDVTPRLGSGPWYMPDYVDLVFTVTAEDGALNLAKITGLKEVMEASGYSVELKLTPKLSATLRIGNFLTQIADANPAIAGNPFKFMGGSLSMELGFELGIPLATFLDYLIPGTGKTVTAIMNVLNMKVNLVNYLSLALGMNYNATTEASGQDVTLKVGFGLDISLKLPSPAEYIKDAIGVSLPLDFIKLGVKLKAKTGIIAQAAFGHKGSSFKVGLFYNLFFKFYASLFWIFKFDVTKSWKDTVPFLEIQGAGGSKPANQEHANLDLDDDGLWDDLEVAMGLDPTLADTDNDLLKDGNELLNYFTSPLDNDTDDDGLSDYEELALFYAVGLDPFADYDNDGEPCIMDTDSDNDGLNDRQELKGMNSVHWAGIIKTDPSLKDTDFDGFSDLEEWMFGGPDIENPHPHPCKNDSDSDGLMDEFEYNWWVNEYPTPDPVLSILNPDVDGEGLLDGEEFDYGTDPTDIDTDGDFDTNDDGVISTDEQNAVMNNGNPGDFTDYGEIQGNTWVQWPFGLSNCKPLNPTPTNPLNNDSDGDDLTDAVEYNEGTNPVSEDSDGDGIKNTRDALFFHANCSEPDTDNDYLQDGREVQYFNLTRGISNDTIASLHYLNDSDIDNDGLLDGYELRIGTDPLNNDTDEDGLLDGHEVEIGSYPLVKDSDEDSLWDGPEVHDYSTNPLRRDTDNDGLTDATEVEEGSLYILYQGNVTYFTDPNDPDSDDDGLTDGEEYFGWNWALDRRVAPGSTEIDEPIQEEDDDYIPKILYSAPDPYRARFQTHPAEADTDLDGLNDGLEKDIVLSPLTDDTDADNWPDFDEIDYMENRFTDTWENVPDIWHYLDYDMDGVNDWEEVQSSTDMLVQDTDMDGLDDWTELFVPVSVANETFETFDADANFTITTNTTLPENERYTDATEFDSDFDGLSDYYELMNGTNPLHPDSDSDGLTDYEELVEYVAYEGPIKVSLDPLNNDTDADGITDHEEVVLCSERMSESGNPSHGPLGDYDMDGIVNVLDYDSDDDGIYDGFEVHEYQDPAWPWHPLGTDMFNADQNSDAYLDGIDTDFDNDSLSDAYEVHWVVPGYTSATLGDANATYRGYSHLINHTLCILEDTDGDGYNDGWEIGFRSDPLDPSIFPNIFQWTIPDFEYSIGFQSTSEVTDPTFIEDEGAIEFDILGPDGTQGFCNITIPKDLLYAEPSQWEVLIDEEETEYEVEINETDTILHFSYVHSEHHVVIRGTEVMSGEITTTTSQTTTTPPPTGFDPMLMILIGGTAAVVVVIMVVIMKMRKS